MNDLWFMYDVACHLINDVYIYYKLDDVNNIAKHMDKLDLVGLAAYVHGHVCLLVCM